jgi:hypothetical protein
MYLLLSHVICRLILYLFTLVSLFRCILYTNCTKLIHNVEVVYVCLSVYMFHLETTGWISTKFGTRMMVGRGV